MSTAGQGLKIVHLDTGVDLRGRQCQLLLLAHGLRQRGHEQLIVCPEGSALEERAGQEEFQILTLPAHDPGHAHGIFQLRQQLLADHYDILHAHDGRSETIVWLASLGILVCRVASRRVTFLPRSPALLRFKYQRTCHGIIAVSEFVKQMLVQSGVPAAKIEVIADGAEIPVELPGADLRSKIRAQWGYGGQEFLIGHVGAFTHEKGQDMALEAALLLAERLPQARMLLAGDGPLRSSSKIQSKVLQARGRARLLGYLENLEDFFCGLELFIMPSRAEGLGSSALLAMAHGLAVVATRVGGLPEVVEEGKTGWLVPPESPSALADAIAAAASDRARLEQFGLKARDRARRFSSNIMIERTESLYRRLLAR